MASLVDWRRVTGQTEREQGAQQRVGAAGRYKGGGFMWDALKLEGKARCCTGSCLQVLVTCLV